MGNQKYVGKIKRIIEEVFGISMDGLSEDSTWTEGLQIDVLNSLHDRNLIEFINRLEDEFEIQISNMKFAKTKNIGEMASFIEVLIEE